MTGQPAAQTAPLAAVDRAAYATVAREVQRMITAGAPAADVAGYLARREASTSEGARLAAADIIAALREVTA